MRTSASSNDETSVRIWALIIWLLILGGIFAFYLYNSIFGHPTNKPTYTTEGVALPPYSEELKRVSNEYRECIASADSDLNNDTKDPMQGTGLSRESTAASLRSDCSRKYETRMRILRSKYE